MNTSKVDSKKRVVIPDGQPGDVFEIKRLDTGRYLLVRLERPEPAKRMSKEACLKAIQASPLRPTTPWGKLREITREP